MPPNDSDRVRAYVLPRLRELLVEGRNVRGSATSPEQLLSRFRDFDEAGRRLLRQEFSDRTVHDRFDTDTGKRLRDGSIGRATLARAVLDDVDEKITVLQDLVGRLDRGQTTVGSIAGDPSRALKGVMRVFVVHGHNEGVKRHVQLVLSRALPSADVIVLHEQPSGGSSTIIEKLERYAQGLDFVVVLLTGDDQLTGPNGTPERRARQNVLLELGYFLAKVGRNRVVALHEAGIALPSDFSGVIYISYEDDGSWRGELLKELDHAGLRPDWRAGLA